MVGNNVAGVVLKFGGFLICFDGFQGFSSLFMNFKGFSIFL
jgi:hypothetical protein